MIKLKPIYITLFMFLFLTIFINNAYSEDNSQFINNTYSENNRNSKYDIKFANTLSVGYFSNCFYKDNIRPKHSTILNKPAFNVDEKFQIILSVGNPDEIETIDVCCMSVPESAAYVSLNLFYLHHENSAIRPGIGLEVGFGNYKNPFLSGGFSLYYLHDMVFNNPQANDVSSFINIGYKDDMHLFFDFSGVLNDAGGLHTYTQYINFELTLGYKKLIPVFLKIKGFGFTNDDKINYTNGTQYSYEQGQIIGLIHIQYYGDNFGLSIGFLDYIESYTEQILNAQQSGYIDNIIIDERAYYGGGMTFYIKNTNNTFELFGEFHLLTDKNKNWMTICKFGTTVYF
jgi:hypothetical protein